MPQSKSQSLYPFDMRVTQPTHRFQSSLGPRIFPHLMKFLPPLLFLRPSIGAPSPGSIAALQENGLSKEQYTLRETRDSEKFIVDRFIG